MSYCDLKSSSFCVSPHTKCSSFWVSSLQKPAIFVCSCFLALQMQDPGRGDKQKELDLGSSDTQKELDLGSGDTQNELDFK